MKFTCGKWLVALLTGILLGSAGAYAQTQPTSITISPQNPTLNVGQTQQFAALSRTPLYFGDGSEIEAGEYHTCALQADGTAKCWGDNTFGELGNGSKTKSSGAPVTVSGLSAATAISAGKYHTCALLSNRTVKCWGDNRYGQLGDGSKTNSLTPVTVSGLSGVMAISAGGGHTCALLSGGTVECWGNNYYGQLGDGNKTDSTTPVAVSGLSGAAVSISTGDGHSCAVLSNGTAECWGSNYNGQLGDGSKADSATPVAVSGLTGAVEITSGINHTCALLSNGTAQCWGLGSQGQLGDGKKTDSTTPVAVSGLSGAVAISAGSYHTCALLSDGTAKCWGSNALGQSGDGSKADRTTPALVSGLSGGVAIAAGGDHTCALLSNGTAQCWGWNHDGALGDGTYRDSGVPVTVTDQNELPGRGVLEVAAGVNHTCSVLWDRTVKCWGANSFGQLGNGSTAGSVTTPVAVSGLSGAVSIAAGQDHSCAVLANGKVECWGSNTAGQLGDGRTLVYSATPVEVSGLSGAVSVAAGGPDTCALLSDGTVKCWGDNSFGELGDGSTTNRYTPATVKNLSGAVAIAAGGVHTCALLANGTARCWGSNGSGELGNGSSALQSTTPVAVSGLTGAVSIAAGHDHTCAVLASGAARCWGDNYEGELGNGTLTNSATPVAVNGLSGAAVSITAGYQFTCAVLSDGTAQCWGYNNDGQLGSGSYAPIWSTTPVAVSGLSGAESVVAGHAHACALLASGTVNCWGDNSYGQLGNGTMNSSASPVPTVALVPSLVWSSSNTSVATIDPGTGLATAKASGSTTITVTYGILSAQTTLTVP